MTPTLLGRETVQKDPPSPRSACPFVSVVVPVRNEERFIKNTLEQLLAQDYDDGRFEVLVADGRSTDATPAIVHELQTDGANLRLLDNPGRVSSAGRNVAIRAARGEVIVIVDGHCELQGRGYLRELAAAFARSGADCVGRPQPLDVASAPPLQRAIAAARASRLGHNPASYIYADTEQFVRPQSVAVAYRRNVFETVGLFDEGFDACEDVEFNHRVEQAGLRCFFTPRVRVRYYPRSTLVGLFRQMARYGRGRVRLLRKHRETFSVACFVPAAFVLGVVMGPLSTCFGSWLEAAYLGALAFYALIVFLTSLLLARRARDAHLLLWLPLVFAAIHGGAGVGILHEAIMGWWRRRSVEAEEGMALSAQRGQILLFQTVAAAPSLRQDGPSPTFESRNVAS